ncbi:hypothetical protein DV738_g1872, partial [Chaetothyriales sp. CBS 135597]
MPSAILAQQQPATVVTVVVGITLILLRDEASVELTPSKTEHAVANQRRHRAALRDYYKLKSQQQQEQQQSPAGADDGTASPAPTAVNNGSPLSPSSSGPLLAKLDDPSFDADKFVASLLASGSLQEILRTEAVLVSEIRNLDGECKALVYNNYNKLIKAVGTIGDMQKGMQKKKQEVTPPLQHQQWKHLAGSGNGSGSGNADQAGLDGVEKLQDKLRGLETVARELNPTTVAIHLSDPLI